MKTGTFYLLYLTLLVCSLFPPQDNLQAQSSEIRFGNLNVENGLPQNDVRAIFQDNYGYMWFGTEMGICRFDGYAFTVFSHNPLDSNSLTNIYINSISGDSNGRILIGTDGGGVNIWNPQTETFKHVRYNSENPYSIDNDIISCFLDDGSGTTWIGTMSGLNRMNNITLAVTRCPLPSDTTSKDRVFVIVKKSPGKLWIGRSSGLYEFDISSGVFSLIPGSPQRIRQIISAKKNNLWLFSEGAGIKSFNPETCRFNDLPQIENKIKQLSANLLVNAVSLNNGILWIATRDSGLISFDPNTSRIERYMNNPAAPYSLSCNQIMSICADRSGVLWAGTYFSGIAYYNTNAKPFGHIYYLEDKKATLSAACAVIMDRNKYIWCGTQNGLFRIDPRTGKYRLFRQNSKDPNSICDNFITTILEDSQGCFWFGSDNGLSRYIPAKEQFINFRPGKDHPGRINNYSTWALTEDNKNQVWAGVWGGGITCFNLNDYTNKYILKNDSLPDGISTNNINALYKDSDGKIWIGTWEGGLTSYNLKTGKFNTFRHDPENPASLGHDNIMSVLLDSKGVLWVGTFGGGLDRLDPETGKFSHLTEKDGLGNNVVFGIVEDKNRNLWLTTGKGISKYNINTNTFRNYDISDGIQGEEFSQNGTFKCPDGRLIFAGINGINYFNPDSIRESTFSPPVYITQLRIFNQVIKPSDSTFLQKPVSMTDLLTLSYKEQTFTFEFVALHFSNPSKILYAYKMEGFDQDWTYCGNRRFATYTNLDPGDYTFWVKATNCDGVWNEKPACIRVVITPPFWKTTWFYILSIVLGIAFIYAIMRLREAKLKRDKQVLEQKVKERTLEIMEQKEEIVAQRDEITAQRDQIVIQRDELEEQSKFLMKMGDKVAKQNEKIKEQMAIVSFQKKEITDSIHYARRIQSAVLPPVMLVDAVLNDHFIIYRPRDIVSGDFYWLSQRQNLLMVAVSDCTGHGVPGAIMSMLGISLLNQIVSEMIDPHQDSGITASGVLCSLRDHIIRVLHQTGKVGEQKDGMDIGFCILNTKTLELQFSGANNPLYLIRKGEKTSAFEGVPGLEIFNDTLTKATPSGQPDHTLYELRADKMPVAIYDKMQDFKNYVVALRKDDQLYLSTDGFSDQFGGPNGKKFMTKRLKRTLLSLCHLPMEEQQKELESVLDTWMDADGRNYEQVDDITVMGIQL